MRFAQRLITQAPIFILVMVSSATVFPQAPTYEQAVARWPDMQRPIAFLGCKDHPDEFAVMWNGNISVQTAPSQIGPTSGHVDADIRTFEHRANDSLQVSFSTGEKPNFSNRDIEDNSTEPSLKGHYLPITQVKIKNDDAILLQEAFVSDERGNGQAAAWNAPVFLRVRFTVKQAGTGDAPIRVWAQIAKNHTNYAMDTRANVRIARIATTYGRALRPKGNSLVDSQELVRMFSEQGFRFYSQLPADLNSVTLREFQLDKNVCEFSLPRKAGAVLELIFPFMPTSEEKIASVRNLSYEKGRASVEKFWNAEIARGMQINVPDEAVNNLWRFSVPLTFMTADAYPNGDRVTKLSSHHYEGVWVVADAVTIPELVKHGYLEEAKAFLDIYRKTNEMRPVPNDGENFDTTDGFLTAPNDYLATGWVPDHGATLWMVCEYYLLTRDQKFLDYWLPRLLKGAEWIARQRARTKMRGEFGPGLMPPGPASDLTIDKYFVFNDAWTYRGLNAVCLVLKAINHKDAKRWEVERDDYRTTFQKAFREATQRTIRWTADSGVQIPLVPWELQQTSPEIHPFYLDIGPLSVGVMGLLRPDDEIMDWALKWLTEGPQAKNYNPILASWDRPASLPYEMASSEPGLSWNIPLRFLRNEREKFLEGFYSLAAGAVSRKFLGGHETRDGIQGMTIVNSFLNAQLRNMLVFENEDGESLDLLRNSPSAWLRAGKQIQVERAQTYFGIIGYKIHSIDGLRVEAEIETPSRNRVNRIRLHLYHPEGKPLRRASVNGTSISVASGNTIEIQNPSGTLKVVAEF